MLYGALPGTLTGQLSVPHQNPGAPSPAARCSAAVTARLVLDVTVAAAGPPPAPPHARPAAPRAPRRRGGGRPGLFPVAPGPAPPPPLASTSARPAASVIHDRFMLPPGGVLGFRRAKDRSERRAPPFHFGPNGPWCVFRVRLFSRRPAPENVGPKVPSPPGVRPLGTWDLWP